MLKYVTMAICDVCGKEERAIVVKSWYDGSRYEAPEGWIKGASVGTIICKECAKKLGKGTV